MPSAVSFFMVCVLVCIFALCRTVRYCLCCLYTVCGQYSSVCVHLCVCVFVVCVLCVLTYGVGRGRSFDLEQCHSIRVITTFNKRVIKIYDDEESISSIGGKTDEPHSII